MLTKQEKLMIMFKSKAHLEMTLEDLQIWKGFNYIRIGDIRFPEMFDFGRSGWIKRTNAIKQTNKILSNVNRIIKVELGFDIRPYDRLRVRSFIMERQNRLEKHLMKLRELRNKRLLELGGKSK